MFKMSAKHGRVVSHFQQTMTESPWTDPELDQDHGRREVARRLIAILGVRHPGLTWEAGTVDEDGEFSPFPQEPVNR